MFFILHCIVSKSKLVYCMNDGVTQVHKAALKVVFRNRTNTSSECVIFRLNGRNLFMKRKRKTHSSISCSRIYIVRFILSRKQLDTIPDTSKLTQSLSFSKSFAVSSIVSRVLNTFSIHNEWVEYVPRNVAIIQSKYNTFVIGSGSIP